MTLTAKIRAGLYQEAISQRAREYATALDPEDRLAWQLELWNQEWKRLREEVPFYWSLAASKRLPNRFSSWNEFFENMPVTYRHNVQQQGLSMASRRHKADYHRTTGGSTAEPLRIPGWSSEINHIWPNFWWALTWHGVNMTSRQFLVWGRAHTLGSGLKGFLDRQKRRLFDHLLGIYRCSAYDLGLAAMERAARELIRTQPDYVYGYSVALDQFARANKAWRSSLRDAGVKVVFGTAESFPAPDSMKLLKDLFNCPVAMEYGSVETGAIAFTSPSDSDYQVFWRQYFLEAEKQPNSLKWRVRVTSLYPRCFPLVRYDLGDEIEVSDTSKDFHYGLNTFKKVSGRCNAYIELAEGAIIHSEAFTHAVKIFSSILAFQVIQDNHQKISIHYIGTALTSEEISQIQQRLKKINPRLSEVPVVKVDRLEQTVAGKTPMVMKK